MVTVWSKRARNELKKLTNIFGKIHLKMQLKYGMK